MFYTIASPYSNTGLMNQPMMFVKGLQIPLCNSASDLILSSISWRFALHNDSHLQCNSQGNTLLGCWWHCCW